MNKTGKIMGVWLLIFMMLFSTCVFADDDDEDAIQTPEEYRASLADEVKAKAIEDGTFFGNLDGAYAGYRDQNAGIKSNFKAALLSDSNIIAKYNLKNDTYTYESDFLTYYKITFEYAYLASYRYNNVSKIASPIELGYDHGVAAGEVQGRVSATIDYAQGKVNSWSQAYFEYLGKGSLETRFNLTTETVGYANKFTEGYADSFMKSYIETYQVLNLETEIRNDNYRLVTMSENVITFDEQLVHFKSGTPQKETKTPITLTFPAGALHQQSYVGVYKVDNPVKSTTGLSTVSSKYIVTIKEQVGQILLKKPITLSFEYYGSERAGIYQWRNNQWVYLHSVLTDGRISTEIPAGYYAGGEYAIYVDEAFKNVSDIGFNWAYRELYTLLRRGIINGGVNFNPSNQITRAELAELIYRSKRITDPVVSNQYVISDANTLGSYITSVEYVVNKGYMPLMANAAFNPSYKVTYADVEVVMARILGRGFSWSEISYKMLNERYHKSAGIANKLTPMTKAEAAYMIYMLVNK